MTNAAPSQQWATPLARSALCLTGLVALAEFPRLGSPLLSPDDPILLNGGSIDVPLFVSQGRLGSLAILVMLRALGTDVPRAAPFFALLGMALCGLGAALVLRFWRLDEPAPEVGSNVALLPLAVGALCALHPFDAEAWSFRLTPIQYRLALVLALAGLLHARRRPLLGGALIALGLSIYQLPVSALAAVLLGAVLLDQLRDDREPAGSLRNAAMATFAGAALAWAAGRVGSLLAGIPPDARATHIALAAVPAQLRAVGRVLDVHARGAHPLGTPLLAWLAFALLVAALVRAWTVPGRAPGRRLLATGALGALVFSPFALPFALGSVGHSPRMYVSEGIVVGAWLAALVPVVASEPSQGPALVARMRRMGLASATLLVFGWIALHQVARTDQERVNGFDRALATRLLVRLDALGGAPIETVAVVGQPRLDLPLVAQGDLARSVFSVPWGPAPLLGELSGRVLRLTREGEEETARKHCATAETFPGPGAVARAGAVGIVCLSR